MEIEIQKLGGENAKDSIKVSKKVTSLGIKFLTRKCTRFLTYQISTASEAVRIAFSHVNMGNRNLSHLYG